MTPLDQFGSVTSSTTTATIADTGASNVTETWKYVDNCSSAITTIVQSHPVPDWTIPLTIIAVLVIALSVIAVFRHRNKKAK